MRKQELAGDDTAAAQAELQAKRKRKASTLGLQITATLLLLAGVGGGAMCFVGVQQGWLGPIWANLTDAQGAVIGAALTIYAAALAAVLGPLLFTGQVMGLREASEQTLADIGNHVEQLTEKLEYVRKLVRQSEEQLLPSAAATVAATDPDKILLAMEGLRQDAAALAEEILARSRKWQSTKEKFAGKWPGRQNYTGMLYNHDLIDEKQVALFTQIDATRRLSREDVSAGSLSALEKLLEELKASTRPGIKPASRNMSATPATVVLNTGMPTSARARHEHIDATEKR